MKYHVLCTIFNRQKSTNFLFELMLWITWLDYPVYVNPKNPALTRHFTGSISWSNLPSSVKNNQALN